jgi:hypothetical protein
MSTIYSKIIKVLKNPSVFFEEVQEENLRHAIKFLVILSIIPAVGAVIITTAIQLLSITGIMDAFHAVMAFFVGIFAGIYVYVIYIIGTLLSCLIIHIFAWIFRCKRGLKATSRAVIYANTPSYLLGALMFIPTIGYFMMFPPEIFCAYLLIIGISKQHDVPIRRSILVVLLPLFIALTFLIYYLLQYLYIYNIHL